MADDNLGPIRRGLVPVDDGTIEVPEGYRARLLKTPSGVSLPIVQAIDDRTSLSTKFRICHGTDSICSSQCRLLPSEQEKYREQPCPLEVELAHDLLFSLATELELKAFEKTGTHFTLESIVEEISQYSLIGEYVKWELLSFRADMELAKNASVLYEKPTETKRGNILHEKVAHPAIGVAESALKAKLSIQKEFMSTKRGRLDRLQKETQAAHTLTELADIARDRMKVDVIDLEDD